MLKIKLVKIEDGLLEQDNFFLVSPFSEFLGDGQYTRQDGVFTLKSGYIERRFEHNEYVLIVEKESEALQEDEALYFYVRKDQNRSGLIESSETTVKNISHWKLVRYDGFIQGYSSSNGLDWDHMGGGEVLETNIQGFQIEGDTPLKIKDYRVYKNPHLTIHGFEEGSVAILEDSLGQITTKSIFDGDNTAKLFLHSPAEYRIRFLSPTGNLIYETDLIYFQCGDVYVNTSYDIELYYKGSLIEYKPTLLNTLKEVVEIKNASILDTYEDIYIRAISMSSDIVEISLDNEKYSEGLIIPYILPQERIALYVRIQKDRAIPSYGTRQFILEID